MTMRRQTHTKHTSTRSVCTHTHTQTHMYTAAHALRFLIRQYDAAKCMFTADKNIEARRHGSCALKHIDIHTCIHLNTHTCTHSHNHAHTHSLTLIHTHSLSHTHTHTLSHTHTHTHKNTHTCRHAPTQSLIR